MTASLGQRRSLQVSSLANLTFGAAVAGVVSTGSAEPMSVTEFSDWLEGQEQRVAVLETRYTVTAYWARPLSEVGAGPAGDLYERLECRWLSRHNLFRLEQSPAEPEAGSEPEQFHPSVINIWDGQGWLQQFTTKKRYEFSAAPTFDSRYDSLFLFNTLQGPSFVARKPLSRLVGSVPLVEQTTEGTRQHFRFELGRGSTLVEVVMEMSEPPRLASVSLTALAGPNQGIMAGKTIGRIVYWVERWGEFDGLTLPKLAYRDAYAYISGPVVYDEPQLTRTIFERRSAINRKDNLPSAHEFSLRYTEGWDVNDNRLNLQYRVGSYQIYVDGIGYQTDVAVHPSVIERLPEITRALQENPSSTVGAFGGPISGAVRREYRAALFGVIAFAVSLALLMLLRRGIAAKGA